MSRPDSIRSIGLKKYLDSTAADHNGLGYKTFLILFDSQVSVTGMAKAFRVSRFTVNKWLSIFYEENRHAVESGHLDGDR